MGLVWHSASPMGWIPTATGSPSTIKRAMDVLQAAHRQHWSYRLRLIRMHPRHERRHRKRRSHVGLLEPQHAQISFPGRDHQDERERPIVFDEHSEGHVTDLASRDTMERTHGRHLDSWAEPEVSAVVDETALRSSLERRASSQRSEPGHQRRRTSERIDDDVCLDLFALTGTSSSDPSIALSRRGRGHEIDDPRVGQHFDVGLGVHCSPKRDLEKRPASPDRDERLILAAPESPGRSSY